MKLGFDPTDEQFRAEIRQWLAENLSGEFERLKFRGGPGDEHSLFELRLAWEQRLAGGGWIGVGWPTEHGGRGLSIEQQVIYHEEYARAGGPGRVGHIGEGLIGPTLIAFGSTEQQQRFLPPILEGRELWCQGYSEPGAGSDLANIRTKAELDHNDGADGGWTLHGQKVWTSMAHESQWCFVLARMDPATRGRHGLGFFLVAMDRPGITVRPIRQLTGSSEFNEVYFDGARVEPGHLVGKPGEGWKVAMGLLGFERGVSTLGQQMSFANELNEIIRIAKENGKARDPVIRQRIADAWMGLKVMRYNAMRTLSANAADGSLDRAGLVYKLFWSTWHRNLGNLAMDVLGAEAELMAGGDPYQPTRLQSLFLFTRADTIYGGTNQIQRNLIAERGLGLPREPRPPIKDKP